MGEKDQDDIRPRIFPPEPPRPQPGQWVRFYRDARMVIGVVQYVQPAASWSRSKWLVSTDHGQVESESILESR